MSPKPQAQVIGPFAQALTLRGLPLEGALSDEQLEVIPHAGVIIHEGKVVQIGAWSQLRDQGDVEVIRVEDLAERRGVSATQFTLTPGLIDAHTHLCFAGSRARDYADRLNGVSYEEICARGGGIRDTMRHTRAATADELYTLNLERLEAHLQRGVTTVEVKSGYGLSVSEELKQLRVIKRLSAHRAQRVIPTCLAAHVLPPEYQGQGGVRGYLQTLGDQLLPQLINEGLTRRIDAFIEPSAFPAEQTRGYLERARSLGFELTLHADQFQRGGAQLAAELGARSADHLEASGEAELRALKAGGVSAVALPGASLGLGIPFTPARTALDLGLSLAIASDWNPGSAPMGHLLLQASVLGASERLSGAEIWAAITQRAGYALGLSEVGALDVGWSADLLAFPVADYREILYHQGMINPALVWARGELRA